MLLKADNVKIDIDELIKTNPREAIIKKLRLNENDVKDFQILRQSQDARFHKSMGIYFVFSVLFDYPRNVRNSLIKPYKNDRSVQETKQIQKQDKPPIIVGAGPSGLFAALRLIEYGLNPIIIERGKDIPDRIEDIKGFWENRILDTESNIQFGLGGAGTFSDGKLRSRIKSPYTKYIANRLIEFGADRSILYLGKPHIGTDKLRKIISEMKDYIEAKGGSIRFNAKLTDIVIKDHRVDSIIINDNEQIHCDQLILGIGNSARDTFEMLNAKDIAMTSKSFAVGVRIEHLQEIIDQYTYGDYTGHPQLSSAEYQLTFHDHESDRNIYSFCNCPGGYVINASSEANRLAVNGMSFSKRNASNANSAIVVNVNDEDFDDKSPLGGMYFQRELEEAAFKLGGSNYNAPAMYVSDFLNQPQSYMDIEPSVRPGIFYTDLNKCLPAFISLSLKNALIAFSTQIEGFDSGIMTAIETRTSSPVRIIRNADTLESTSTKGLYPIGEGAGYAGGIISSAVDGVRTIDQLIKNISILS